jgi:F-type H+-transporting ATPase subunit delta
MDSGSVPRRYAKALFSLAVEVGQVEPWSDTLAALATVLRQNPDLAAILAEPLHSREERHAIAERLAGALKLGAAPRNLLFLLGDRNRLDRLPDVLRAFGELADAHLGRVRARVTSAVPLDGEMVEALTRRLSDLTQATVLLDRKVEPALLGGLVAQVGSFVYDASVRTQLEDLKKSLKR